MEDPNLTLDDSGPLQSGRSTGSAPPKNRILLIAGLAILSVVLAIVWRSLREKMNSER
jgi:hypothetical protein